MVGFVFFCCHNIHLNRAQEKSSQQNQASTVQLKPTSGQSRGEARVVPIICPDLLRNLLDSGCLLLLSINCGQPCEEVARIYGAKSKFLCHLHGR